MAEYTGHESWLGIGEQAAAFGTGVAPTIFLPLVSETMTQNTEVLHSNSVQATASRRRYRDGRKTVAGNIVLELWMEDMTVLWAHLLGALSAAVHGAEITLTTQTLTLADAPLSFGLSLEINRGGAGATSAFRYVGCRVQSATIDIVAGVLPTVTFAIIGQVEQTPTLTPAAVASPTYTDVDPFSFHECDFKLNDYGSAVASVECLEFHLTIENGFKTDKNKLNSQLIAATPRDGKRMVSGSFRVEFDDFTHYDRYTTPTEGVGQMLITSEALAAGAVPYHHKIDIPRMKFTGEPPQVSGPALMEHNMTFDALYDIGNTLDEVYMEIVDGDDTWE